MSPREVDATSLLPQEDIISNAPYKFIGIAGSGGSGTVYKAIDKKVGRTVAIKAITPSVFEEFDAQKFEREAKAISKLQHPNVLTILDSGSMIDGRPYLVTEWIEGCTLAEYLESYGKLSEESAEEVFSFVLDGLSHAHNRNIVHRDIKPGNIMLSRTNYGWIVKLIDFGTAKDIGKDQSITRNEDLACSPYYASPEQLREVPIDNRADLYSIGCTMFEALTGRPPFTGKPMVVAMRHQSEPPPTLSFACPGSHFPEYIEQVVARLLAKNPEERFATAEAVKAAIQARVHSKSYDSTISRIIKAAKRHPYAVSASLAAIAIPMFALSAIYQLQKNPQPGRVQREEEAAFRQRLASITKKWSIREEDSSYLIEQSAAEMLSLLEEAIKKFGNASLVTIDTLQDLDLIYSKNNKRESAIAIHENHLQSLAFNESTADYSGSSTRAIAKAYAANLTGMSRLKSELGKTNEAEKLSKRALEITTNISGPVSEDVAEGLLWLGKLQRSTDLNSAILSLERANEILRAQKNLRRTDIDDAIRQLVQAYYNAMRFEDAKLTLMHSTSNAEHDIVERHRLLSLILLRQNDRERAREEFTKLMSASQGDLTQGARRFRINYLLEWAEACQLSPDHIDESQQAAERALSEIGKVNTDWDRTAELNAEFRLAKAEFYLSHVDKAINDLQESLKNCPANQTRAKETLYRGLGQCFSYGRDDYKTAETYHRKALALPNASADNRYWLGIALYEQGKIPESMETFEDNLKHAAAPTRILHRLMSFIFIARILQRQGNRTEAKEQLRHALQTFDQMSNTYPGVCLWLPAFYLSIAAGEIEGFGGEQRKFADIALAEATRYYPKSPTRTSTFNYQQSLKR